MTTEDFQPHKTITVSAVVITRGDGAIALVRKAGTEMFMFPGGKHQPEETSVDAAVRELLEETGVEVPASSMTSLGRWETATANEPGWRLISDVFRVDTQIAPENLAPHAEIEQLIWAQPHNLDAAVPRGYGVAPLVREVFTHEAHASTGW